MSRVGKKPICIPNGVTVEKQDLSLLVKGPKGEQRVTVDTSVVVEIESDLVKVSVNNNEKAKWGLYRTLISNAVEGVSKGFSKVLEINGVGYKASVKDNFISLSLGLSHEVRIEIPESIEAKPLKATVLEISSFDKEKLGQFAAVIRDLRLPEPYKGKGIKYEDEYIFRKEGKK